MKRLANITNRQNCRLSQLPNLFQLARGRFRLRLSFLVEAENSQSVAFPPNGGHLYPTLAPHSRKNTGTMCVRCSAGERSEW